MNVLLAACAALATAIAIASAAQAQVLEIPSSRTSAAEVSWDWRGPASSDVIVNLARGDIRIVRSNLSEVHLNASMADVERDGTPVALVVSNGPGVVRIIDRYPARMATVMRECLPLDGEHGDLWHYMEHMTLTISMPSWARVSATTMAGGVSGR